MEYFHQVMWKYKPSELKEKKYGSKARQMIFRKKFIFGGKIRW